MKRTLIILAIALSLYSCRREGYFGVFDMPLNRSWGVGEWVEFDFVQSDTINLHKIELSIRHSLNFGFRNLPVEIQTHSPDNKYWRDTIILKLTDADNDWVGQMGSNHIDFQSYYRRNVRFTRSGNYVIKVKHLLPVDSLEGVNAVGIIVETDGKK